MKIKVYDTLDSCREFDGLALNVPQAISLIRVHTSDEYANNIINNNCCYVAFTKGVEAVCLDENFISGDISNYEELMIFKNVDGDISAVVLGLILTVAQIALVVVSIVGVVLSITSAPDTSFDNDTASDGENGASALISGVPNRVTSGGSLALNYGTAHWGATRISVGIATEDVGVV